ncbi:MAG: Gfo/Idh/MocA family oxidoreductase [Melioribacteraceae bacterium]|nr:Gfo/Idh/MocA family oxidoreductase [Melioribacteraceae bacterium]
MNKASKRIKLPRRKVVRLRWGVAGCGSYLENTFLPTLKNVKKSKLVSVYSSDINRAKFIANKFNAEKSSNSYDEFLTHGFDAVYISSKNSDHYKQVIKAAEAGKHILCEKPMALNSAQAKEMVDVCEKNNVHLAINFVYRFNPLVAKAKELIDKQIIGRIVTISTDFNIDYAPNDNFRFKKHESGGGALFDLGTHMIDLLRFFGGDILSINGNKDNIIYNSEVEDFANGIVKFKSSGYGYFNVSFNTKKPFNRIEILGYKGCISIDNMVGRKNASSKIIIELSGEAKKAFRRKANNQAILLKGINRSFLKNEKPAVTGYDGLVNVELMEQIGKF